VLDPRADRLALLVGDLPRDPDAALQLDVRRGRLQPGGVGDAQHAHQVRLAVGRADAGLVALGLGHAEQAVAALLVGDGAEALADDVGPGDDVTLDDRPGDRLAAVLVADDAADRPARGDDLLERRPGEGDLP